jgi:hypothetical protein
MSARLPGPSLTRVDRLQATLGEPPDLGDAFTADLVPLHR